jgi:hypothetical protein
MRSASGGGCFYVACLFTQLFYAPQTNEHMALNNTDAACFFYGHNYDAIYRR